MRYDWLLILALSCVVYANSIGGGFHYDDEHSIQRNFQIRELANIPDFFADPGMFSWDPGKAMYRPLLLLTYAVNFAWGGYGAVGYHVVNITIHAFNALLVAWLGWLLSGRRLVGCWAGLLFAVHPICSEPVNYISSRSESLTAFFYMSGLALFVHSQRYGKPLLVWASAAALALGLLSKATSITLPVTVVLWDFLFISGRSLGNLRRRFVRLHLPGCAVAAVYMAVIHINGFLPGSLEKTVRGAGAQLLTQTKALIFYGQRLVMPTGLNVEPQFFEQEVLVEASVLAALAMVISFLGALWYQFRRHWDLSFFLNCWGIIALLPVLVMPLNVLVNERRLYLSCAAFCIGLAAAFCKDWSRRGISAQLFPRFVLGGLLLLVYCVGVHQRNIIWREDLALWRDAVARAPLMPRVHLYLGNSHKDIAIGAPTQPQAMVHWRHAATSYENVIDLGSDAELSLRALNNLGGVYWHLGEMGVPEFVDLVAAEDAYRRAVELRPNYADAWVNMASIVRTRAIEHHEPDAQRAGLLDAHQLYARAIGLAPNHSEAIANIGRVLHDLGEYTEARNAYERALFLKPNDARTLKNLGNLNIDLGQQKLRAGEDGTQHLIWAKELLQRAARASDAQAKVRAEARQSLVWIERLLRQSR